MMASPQPNNNMTKSALQEQDESIDNDDAEDNESFCYESDYEYNDDDDDDESDEDGVVSSAGFKRKTPAPVSSTTTTTPETEFHSKSIKGNLKATGLDDDGDASSHSSSTPQPASHSHPEDEWTCRHCHGEAHSPVLACDMVRNWSELTGDRASGILSVDPHCIILCMRRRVRECHSRLRTEFNDFEPFQTISEGQVAVDLQRYHWNTENWQAAMRRRVETHRVRLDNNNNDAREMLPWMGRWEAEIQRLQQDHNAFLRSTMEEFRPIPAATPDPKGMVASLDPLFPTTAARVEKAEKRYVTWLAANGEETEDEGPNEMLLSEMLVAENDSTDDVKLAPAGLLQEGADASLDLQAPTVVPVPATVSFKKPKSVATSLVSSLLVKPITSLMGCTPKEAESTPLQDSSQHVAISVEKERPPATQDFSQHVALQVAEPEAWTCAICMDDEVEEEDRLSMECGHEYCRDCWAQFIVSMLEDTRALGGVLAATSHCPHQQCDLEITRRHVQQMAPESLPMYDEMTLNSFLAGHCNTMRWCPGVKCGHVAIRSRPGLLLDGQNDRWSRCDFCSTRFCFGCGNAPHDGRDCERIYEERRMEPERHTGPRLPVRARGRGRFPRVPFMGRQPQPVEDKADKKIRRCPSCAVPIEKKGGCNHMTCRCGREFCWLCLADTTGMHAAHWCGREPNLGDERLRGRARHQPLALRRIDLEYLTETLRQPNSQCSADLVADMLQKQWRLNRYAHYFNRYQAHHQGQVFAEKQCECLTGRVNDFVNVSDLFSGTDTDSFFLANRLLVASRRMLKYTYCFLYYKLAALKMEETEHEGFINDDGCPADNAISSSLPTPLALFLDHQERLERFTEQLSYLSENCLTRPDRKRVVDMMNTVERCMQAVTAISCEDRDGMSAL